MLRFLSNHFNRRQPSDVEDAPPPYKPQSGNECGQRALTNYDYWLWGEIYAEREPPTTSALFPEDAKEENLTEDEISLRKMLRAVDRLEIDLRNLRKTITADASVGL